MKSCDVFKWITGRFRPPQTFYASHSKRGCYRAALSNMLLLGGDEKTAEKVFWGYPGHEFVGVGGATIAATAPRILGDLTGHAYEGTLYACCRDMERELELSARKRFGEKADTLIKAVMDDMEAGKIMPREDYRGNGDSALYIIRYEFGGVPFNHWVAAVPSEGFYIDNGIVMRPFNPLAASGVMAVRKIGHEKH